MKYEKYKVVTNFRHCNREVLKDTEYKQDGDGDYISLYQGYLPAAFVENNPKFFKRISDENLILLDKAIELTNKDPDNMTINSINGYLVAIRNNINKEIRELRQ